MFYKTADGHGLPHDPFKALVAPRPVGWISTVDEQGVHNIAPYSFFNAISTNPHMLAFSSEGLKDSVVNARATGEFVYNVATIDLKQEMKTTSERVEPDMDEFVLATLEYLPSNMVKPRRVANAPASMECKVVSCTQLKDIDGNATDGYLIVGQVIAIHIRDDLLKDGLFDTAAASPLGRCGYMDYTVVDRVFQVKQS